MDIFPVVPGMTLELGKTGTHYVRAFRFDISAWQEAYPDGIINLIHRMPDANEPYVAGYLRLGEGYIDWVVQSSDVAVPGYGECELVMIVDGVAVDKTDTYPTHIEEQLGTNSVTPPTGATWVEQVLTVGNATLQAVEGFEDLVDEKEQDITDLASGKEQNITDLAAQKIAAIEAKGAQTLDSIPEDYTELSGEVTELKSALNAIGGLKKDDLNDLVTWEVGTIGVTGKNESSTTRIRTVNGVSLENYDYLDISIDTGYKWNIFWYDANEAVVSDDICQVWRMDSINKWPVPSGAVKTRFLVSDTSNGTASTDYAEHITVKLYPYASVADEVINEVDGTPTQVNTTVIDGLNFAANAVKYTAGSNYETYYVPVTTGKEYKVTYSKGGSTASGEWRLSYSKSIPVANGAGTFLGNIVNIPTGSVAFAYYTAAEDGYLCMSIYKGGIYSYTVEETSGGIRQRIAVIESTIEDYNDEIEEINQNIEQIDESINGVEEAVTPSSALSLYLAANAVKYTDGGTSYETYYIPVTKGNNYQIILNNQSSNHWYVRFGLALNVPAVNVAATYLTQIDVSAKNTGSYAYIAPTNGYLSLSSWAEANTSFTATEVSGGIEQRLNADEGRIAAVEVLGESIDGINAELADMKGQTIQLESGSYWGATTVGSSLESGIQSSSNSGFKRTTLTLPANTILRIMGVGAGDLTRLYWAFRASDGLLIDIVDAYDQLSPQAYYLRYDVETHIYINCSNAYDHFIGIVDDLSPFVDISKLAGQTFGKIIDNCGERDIRYAVRNMKRKSRSGSSYAPALFLHFSDIHGDTESLSRLMEFASDYHIGHYLNDILCTGDIVKNTLDDGMTWFDSVSGTDKILMLPGNHDCVKGSAGSPTSATKQEMYEAVFANRVAEWGVTQPEGAATNYLGYYYKDYATQKLRLICLDSNGSGDYQTAQVTWFADTLEAAYDLGYSVVCAQHFVFDRSQCTGVKCTFNSDEAMTNEGSWVIPNAYISAVETFIDYGGEFVCWLGGHVHKDRVLLHENEHQLCIGVTTACHKSPQTDHEDCDRILGDKSQDAFNIVGIDTFSKRITVLRIGSDLTRMLAHKRYLCLDYENRTVVWND